MEGLSLPALLPCFDVTGQPDAPSFQYRNGTWETVGVRELIDALSRDTKGGCNLRGAHEFKVIAGHA